MIYITTIVVQIKKYCYIRLIKVNCARESKISKSHKLIEDS